MNLRERIGHARDRASAGSDGSGGRNDTETLALAQRRLVGFRGSLSAGVYRHLANWPAYLAHVGALMWPYLETGEILRASTV